MTWWLEFVAGVIVVLVAWLVVLYVLQPNPQETGGPDESEVVQRSGWIPRKMATSSMGTRIVFGIGATAFLVATTALLAWLGLWFAAGIWPTMNISMFASLWIAAWRHANK